eukprot:scaffold17669_cov61-Phaeocystis_antarctica.AAC.1
MLRLARPVAAGHSSMGRIRCHRPRRTSLAFDIVLRLVPVVVFDGARAACLAIFVPEVVLRRVHLEGLWRLPLPPIPGYPNPNPNPNQGAWPSRTLIGKQQGALASRA